MRVGQEWEWRSRLLRFRRLTEYPCGPAQITAVLTSRFVKSRSLTWRKASLSPVTTFPSVFIRELSFEASFIESGLAWALVAPPCAARLANRQLAVSAGEGRL